MPEPERQPPFGQVPENWSEQSPGLSLKGTFADAVLAARSNMEKAEELFAGYVAANDGYIPPEGGKGIETLVRLSEGWSALARALQHGAPGERL